MAANPTPTNDHQLLILCDQVAAGCERLGGVIEQAAEAGPRLKAAVEAARERMAEVKRLKPRRSKRRAEFRTLDREGERVIARCRLRLAALYGSRHNAQWQAAGFTQGTTMVPEDFATRLQVLAGLARFFQKNPDQESRDMGATAAICQETHTGLEAARQAVHQSETKLRQAVLAKGGALKALRGLLRKVILRLRRVLPGDDPRWLGLGLKPPKAGAAQAQPVASLVLTPRGGGSFEVRWPATLQAETYQIQARPMGAAGFTTVKTIRDQEALLTGWPAGQIVEVRVVAANPLGHAEPSPVMAVWVT